MTIVARDHTMHIPFQWAASGSDRYKDASGRMQIHGVAGRNASVTGPNAVIARSTS